MYDRRRVVSITCARGSSKGVPGKNLRLLRGKPLIAHTLEVARASRYLDECLVSTDSPEIAEVARQWGASVPFLRPAELARDDTPHLPVLKHALKWLRDNHPEPIEAVVTLQATTPMRTAEQIDAAIELLFCKGADAVLGVVAVEHSPYWMFVVTDGRLHPLLPLHGDVTHRQALPRAYRASGSIYVNRADRLLAPEAPDRVPLWELGSSVVPLVIEDPLCRIDLDTEEDFALLEVLLARRTRGTP